MNKVNWWESWFMRKLIIEYVDWWKIDLGESQMMKKVNIFDYGHGLTTDEEQTSYKVAIVTAKILLWIISGKASKYLHHPLPIFTRGYSNLPSLSWLEEWKVSEVLQGSGRSWGQDGGSSGEEEVPEPIHPPEPPQIHWNLTLEWLEQFL